MSANIRRYETQAFQELKGAVGRGKALHIVYIYVYIYICIYNTAYSTFVAQRLAFVHLRVSI
jgi:hypothetical protein